MADQEAKKAAQGPMTLVVRTQQPAAEEINKRTLTEEEGRDYLANIHHLTHLGTKKLLKLVSKSPYKDFFKYLLDHYISRFFLGGERFDPS